MKRRQLCFISALGGIFIGIILCEPVSVVFYRIKEPHFKWPIKTGFEKSIIRSDSRGDGSFGAKRRNGRLHSGIDMLAPVGTPVYASKSGVAFSENAPTGYGKYVMIAHPGGFQTLYGHLSGWNVFSTQRVRQGEIIGYVGKTGNAANKSIEPHLHFEIRRKGEALDPQALIR